MGGAAWVGWFVKTRKTIRTSLSQRGAKVFFFLSMYKAGSGCTPTHSACSRIEKPPDFGRKTCVIQAAFGMHFSSFGFILDPLDSFSFFVYRIECLPPKRGCKAAPLGPGPTSPFKILNCKTTLHVGAWPLTHKLRGHTQVPHLLISLSRILPGWAVLYTRVGGLVYQGGRSCIPGWAVLYNDWVRFLAA